MERKKTQNEIRVIEGVSLSDYYNKNIAGLKEKFKPMEDNDRVTICPFHDDNTPSLYNWKKRNIFHCFACGFGGDVVRVHKRIRSDYYNEKLDTQTAVKQLAQTFGIDIDIYEGFKAESVFERAKMLVTNENIMDIPKTRITLGKFSSMNANIVKMDMSVKSKVENLANLDLMIASQHQDDN